MVHGYTSAPNASTGSPWCSSAILETIYPQFGSIDVSTLRPDLTLRAGSKLVAIGDTKWKLVKVDEAGRLQPSNADLLQMYAYAAAYQCSELALIYPWSSRLERTVDTYIDLPETQGKVIRVHVVCVEVHSDRMLLISGARGNWFGGVLGG